MTLRKPRALLFDMDGVLYNDTIPIAGAREALAWVRREQIPHLFVTNTSSRSRSHLAEKLVRFGIAATEDESFPLPPPPVSGSARMPKARHKTKDPSRSSFPKKLAANFPGSTF